MKLSVKSVLASVVLALVSTQAQAWDKTNVKVGVVGENNEFWQPIIDKLRKEGVNLELVRFATYPLPNRALEDGEIDLNAFQTGAFFKTESKEYNYHLVAIGTTVIAPLSLYSDKIKSPKDIKAGDTVTLANDPISTGRGLRVLEDLGFIKIKDGAGYLPGPSDVVENKQNLKFFFVDAANTYNTLPDVTAGFINGGYAVDHGLNPRTDAIYTEKTEGWGLENPFVNVIAAREAEKDDPLYQHIVELYHTKEVADIISNSYKGALIPAFKYQQQLITIRIRTQVYKG